jgi:polyisoprenoid-binding protein YceI
VNRTTNYLATLAMAAIAAAACAKEEPAAVKPAVPAPQSAGKPVAASASTPAVGLKHFAQAPGGGSLTFTFVQEGAENRGAFTKFATQLDYDEQHTQGSLRVTVHMSSLDTQNEDRDTTLASSELFDTAKHPTATYIGSSIVQRAGTGLEAIGKLTLRGTARDLRLPLTLKRAVNGYELSGEVTIKRLDYGVGQGDWASTDSVANEVKISYRVPLLEVGSVRAP